MEVIHKHCKITVILATFIRLVSVCLCRFILKYLGDDRTQTLARASLAASASAAIALCSCTGRRTSLLQQSMTNGNDQSIHSADTATAAGRYDAAQDENGTKR